MERTASGEVGATLPVDALLRVDDQIRWNSWVQSTGQTSTQERSLMSMQGSAMMYVIPELPFYRPASLLAPLPSVFLTLCRPSMRRSISSGIVYR